MEIKTPKQAYEHAYTHGLKFPVNWNITKNFTWNEVFTNEVNSDGFPLYEVFVNAKKLADYLQVLRDKLNKPIIIHCWVRQIPHNKRAGSTAKYSAHLNGLGVDFHVQGVTEAQVRAYLIALKMPIRIEANTQGWVHIDISNYVIPFKTGLFYC